MPSQAQTASALGLTLAALISQPLLAEEARYNQVALRAEVSQEVAHDQMQVSLYSEAQDKDPAKLAAQITQTINQALTQARASKGVTVSLGNRNSYPIYDGDNRKISAWRDRKSTRLNSSHSQI